MHPLQPLSHGNVLIVGVKSSNFNDEIRTHPRVIIWDSQQQHWTDKTLPTNTRAIFVTRFIGHTTFGKIIKEARKKQITIFNPEGTGIIARQVKELLNMTEPPIPAPEMKTEVTEIKEEMKTEETMPKVKRVMNKLKVFHPLIDLNKTNIENARFLMIKAKEMGISTTEASLGQLVSSIRLGKRKTVLVKITTKAQKDVSIQMFDSIIKEMTDIREFFIATVEENQTLKARLLKFKQFLDGDLK